MMEQQIIELMRRMDIVEQKLDGIHRLELAMAEVKGALGIMRWTLPLIVGIGGLTVAALSLLK